jgi:FtsP/CotA-like multicopper oxidase with cupredoxin domain
MNNPLALTTGPELSEPAIIDTTVTPAFIITVEQCTNTVANFATWTTRCYCYLGACSVPGPTLLMQGGHNFDLTLVNKLPADTEAAFAMNTMHTPSMTNVHTHGLHVDPAVDNIFVMVDHGQNHTYHYEIPIDHAPGNHWYHSHLHGTSALQVMGGLVGAIIMLPPAGFVVPPSIAAMARYTLVFTHHDLSTTNQIRTSAPFTEYNDPFTCWNYQQLQAATGDTLAPGTVFTGAANVADAFLTNGQYMPQKTVKKDEWVIFDIVNAVGDRILELELRSSFTAGDVGPIGATYDPNTNCQVYLLATDGSYLSAARAGGYVNHLLVVQAGRMTVAVMCNAAGTYYLQSTYSSNVMNYEVSAVQHLLTLKVSADSPAVAMSAPDLTGMSASAMFASLLTTAATGSSALSIAVEQTTAVNIAPAMFMLGVGSDCTVSTAINHLFIDYLQFLLAQQ